MGVDVAETFRCLLGCAYVVGFLVTECLLPAVSRLTNTSLARTCIRRVSSLTRLSRIVRWKKEQMRESIVDRLKKIGRSVSLHNLSLLEEIPLSKVEENFYLRMMAATDMDIDH